jgi:hypothetical protein
MRKRDKRNGKGSGTFSRHGCVPMTRYDPEIGPLPHEWLAIGEDERVHLVEQYHRDARIRLPKGARHMHATIHAVVENQLALEDQTIVRATLTRLLNEGLSRHDAVHAVGSVLIEHIYDIVQGKSAEPDPHASYYAALEQLTAAKWRAR